MGYRAWKGVKVASDAKRDVQKVFPLAVTSLSMPRDAMTTLSNSHVSGISHMQMADGGSQTPCCTHHSQSYPLYLSAECSEQTGNPRHPPGIIEISDIIPTCVYHSTN